MDDVGARRLHALPVRQERHDVPLYPPEQRPHGGVRGQGRVQARRLVRGRGRREGDRRPADRVRGRLGRRRGQPPSPLRGAPEGRRRGEPVPVPERGRAPALPCTTRGAVLARVARDARGRRRRGARARRHVGALVARRPVDARRRHAVGQGLARLERSGRLDARRRSEPAGAPDAPGEGRSGRNGDRLHEAGPRDPRGATRRRRRARRRAHHAPRRDDRRCRPRRPGRAGFRSTTRRTRPRRAWTTTARVSERRR